MTLGTAWLAVLMFGLGAHSGAEPNPARLVTFNIRYASAKDGPDRWELRRDKVVRTITDLDADVVGLQEAEARQVDELLRELPRYAAIGVHRDDGRTRGEASPILFDRRRFTVAESGTFWLSDTPEQVGSVTWDNAITRVCSFARLIELKSGRGLWVFNTHFDHRGQGSRVASARLVLERMRATASRTKRADPVVLLGDLNSAEDNEAVAILCGRDGKPASEVASDAPTGFVLVDSYRRIHPEGAAGTFTGFQTESDGGSNKIDYVFLGPGLSASDAGIERRRIDGRFPSDHFPVWATIDWD